MDQKELIQISTKHDIYFTKKFKLFLYFDSHIYKEQIIMERGKEMFQRVFTLILTILLSIVFISTAAAKPKTAPPPKEDLAAKSIGIQSQQYLKSFYSDIRDSGDWVAISGTTTASQIVDKISVDLYLQKWDGLRWITIKGPYPFVNYNDDRVEGDKGIQVIRGFYYRTYAKHLVQEGSVTEPAESWSGSILVD
ncbi:MAG: hypothetical protein ACYC0Q_11470 [Eubacteriales bacterium]